MGFLCKLVDASLLLVFSVIALAAPLIDSQTFLPQSVFPELVVDLKKYYIRHYDDYLLDEMPNFFVGLIWVELLFQWPLAVLNIYGILAYKPWFKTTCLIYGVSVLTSMAAILGELIGSQKASDKLMMMYCPFMGFGILAMLRGLVPCTNTSGSMGKKPASATARKKRA
ncbi:hypothetical protein SLEP1_g24349 [Rubroshorea leprosula]|uniref:EXPERA domain-containing protein n=1 Tax=Rubroshorea leprosula TaxID=152421 RepID=A0AAV5JP38_9ROSI|nr:hypothetical protein SLEP1_g24349 [Rubroshorea leprosula]